ncbi:MAG: efflux RND transporter periplasmic adaptor subunit [Kaiparowitsia implicata GSE-PSE-MK54-09C]|nr:efflux RND transporter periplasmic adaptor subunit [Kaiparowitsia implicata GSE-PSE-MK54-09C]
MKRVTVGRSGQFVGTALATALLVGACSGGPPDGMMGGPPGFPVELQQLESGTVQASSEFVGALEAQEKVSLRPEISGRVVQVFVAEGDPVQAGTPIAQLRADRSQAGLTGAIADVEEAQASVNTATARLRAAVAQRERAESDVRLQETEFRRTEALVTEGALAQQDLDRAANSRSTAQSTLQAAIEEIGVAEASLAEARSRFERSRADQAVATEDVQDQRIVSPITGVVGSLPVNLGDVVSATDTLASIVQNDILELNISVPIERALDLRVGLPVELLNAAGEAAVRGQISFISPDVNQGNQSVLAKIAFANNGSLRDGQFVRTRLIWSTEPGVLVPSVAVTRIAGQPFVYVAETGEEPGPDGQPMQIARQRPVTLGALQGNDYQVVSGLEPGEQVVVSGILNLQDGAPILTEQPVSQQ